ncbi:DNA translocase FtsK [Kitasatospora sp. NPDC002227]|uniref:DNA translocase FtsK n=1 Tax=Kitasatospora sp. NPDC002227 TaxID=3154773 RepID=UPI00331C88D5
MTEILEGRVLPSADPDLIRHAVELVVSTQFGSPSMVQRKLRLGWAQVQDLFEQMEAAGIVGPAEGGKARELLFRTDEIDEALEAVAGSADADVLPFPGTRTPVDAVPADRIPVDLFKTDPAPADDEDQDDEYDEYDEDEEEDEEALEGEVYLAEEWELEEDAEGDAPWINPALLTSEGRRARARYLMRRGRRKLRRWVKRQASTRGIVPSARRGTRRIHTWVIGAEGRNAQAALQHANMLAIEAKRSGRNAQFALMKREQKRKLAEQAQKDSRLAAVQAEAVKKAAQKKIGARAALAWGPFAALDLTAFITEGGLGLAGGVLASMVVLAKFGRTPDLDEAGLEQLEREELGLADRFEVGMTPRMFEQMLHQALTEDLGIAVQHLRIRPEPWGFEVEITFHRQTPAKLSEGLADLEACLPGVRTNSILLQQSAKARNEAVLRVPGKDPWKAVPELPYRAPGSVSTATLHTAQIGADMSGRPLALPGKRTSVGVIGKPRSGKSTLIRAAVDALTACEDRIVVGIDLGSYGAGFGPYVKDLHALGRTVGEARRILEWALAIGENRPKLFNKLGMGLNWESSKNRPGITVIIDEFPALVTKAKLEAQVAQAARKGQDAEDLEPFLRLDELAQQIHLTSAKSDVVLVVGSQGVTKDRVGPNTWLSELPAQLMCACDVDDIKLIAGGGAMAQGWRPDRLLPAMGDAVNDASVTYVMAGGAYTEPIPYRASILSDEEAARRADERLRAGLPQLDAESAAFVRDDLADLRGHLADDYGDQDEDALPALIALIREVFEKAGDPAGFTAVDLAEALGEQDVRWELEEFETTADGEPVTDPVGTRVVALRTAIKAVLEPLGLAWKTDSFRPEGAKGTVKGYRLKDLKEITGEA